MKFIAPQAAPAESHSGSPCAVYVELVKTLQNKADSAKEELKRQSDNILEQQMQLKTQQEEAERLKQRYVMLEKSAALKEQKAAALEEMSQE